jgi:hypothetical protein
MNDHLVRDAMTPLFKGTPGWDDPETVAYYVEDLSRLADSDCLRRACAELTRSWTQNRRPPLAVVIDAYQAELRRQRIATVSLSEDVCELCDSTGFLGVTDDRRHASWCTEGYRERVGNCRCHAVEPCPLCAGGDPGPGGVRAQVDENGYSDTKVPSFLEGIEIARHEYMAECAREGREANPEFFNRAIGRVLARHGE